MRLLQTTIGLIYLWFGGLKFFAHLSPAEELASRTLQILTFDLIPENINYLILATGETSLGLLLIIGLLPAVVIRLAIAHMICTFLPILLIPGEVFTSSPLALTLAGQYIMKNMVILSALLILVPSKNRMRVSVNNIQAGESGIRKAI